MSKIFISNNGESKEYEAYQITALWKQGVLAADSLYWKEGMTDWRPLKEYLEETNVAIAQPPPLSAPVYSYTKNIRGVTRVLIVLLGLFIGMEFISLASGMAQMSLLESAPYSEQDAAANDARQQAVALAYMAVYLITAIVFGVWIYRAAANARGFGADWMQTTPGWAVGWYFVPFANLVKPYQAMKEIWNASANPRGGGETGGAVLGTWWLLYLLNGVLGQVSMRMNLGADTVPELKDATMASVVGSVAGIPLGIIAIVLVSSIAAKQRRLVTGA